MDENRQPGVRFVGVQLTELVFVLKGPAPNSIPFGPSFDITEKVSEDGETAAVIVSCDLFGALKSEERPPVDFKFTLVGQFQATKTPNMPLQEFAKEYAPAHLFPYIRELITNITARSPLPILNLGPVNLLALSKKTDSNIEADSTKKPVSQL